METVLLFDLLSIAYRWYFAMKTAPMSCKGLNTSPLHGTMRTILLAAHKYETDNIVVCHDFGKKQTFRHKMFPEYKAGRQQTDDDMKQSLKHLQPMLEALNIPVVKAEGWEADDIIGSYCKQITDKGMGAIVVTGDKDMLQLISEQVYVDRWEREEKQEVLTWTPRVVRQKLGLANPLDVITILALEGDSSDNYKGVPGIGKDTARRLAKRFGTLEEIYDMIHHLPEKDAKKLEEHREQAELCRTLATIRQDMQDEIPAIEDLIPWKRVSVEAAEKYLKHYEMNMVIKNYRGEALPGKSGKGSEYKSTIKPHMLARSTDQRQGGYLF